MRSVSQIDNPRVGMFVHLRTPAGEFVRGRVKERRLDQRGAAFFVLADNAGTYRPGVDKLTFYSSVPKAARSKIGSDEIHRRDAAIVAANLRRQLRFAVIVASILAFVAVSGCIAVTLLLVL